MTTSASTTAGKTSCPDVRRGVGEAGRVVKTAITDTARDILLPLCGHHRTIRNSSSHITYQAARPRSGKSHTREMGRIEEGIIIAGSTRGGAHQSEGQGLEFPIPRLPPWSGDQAPAKDRESEDRQ